MCYTKNSASQGASIRRRTPSGRSLCKFSIFLRGCKQPKSVLKRAESIKFT